jgi:uncharacterized membrane protein YoaT (DUF817 family)
VQAEAALTRPWYGLLARGRDLWSFAYLQLLSSVFPIAIFLFLGLSRVVHVPGLPRYDLLLLLCLAMQAAMVISGLETLDELKVICVFHVLGLALELFKTRHGSWGYPETAYTKLGTVPLYSGFMYASVASYICQAWRRFDLHIESLPRLAMPLAVGIYVNFFTLHYLWDMRWLLVAAVCLVFARCQVRFRVGPNPSSLFSMPLALAFALIGFFLWIGENIGTFNGAWLYPNQRHGWEAVSFAKAGSWFLLVIVSFVIVAWLKGVKGSHRG